MARKRPHTKTRTDRARTPHTKRMRRGALAFAAAGTATAMALAPITPAPPAEADIIDTVCQDIPLVNCSFTEAGLVTYPLMQIVATLYSIPFISAELPPGTIDGIPIIGSLDVNALIPAAINRFVLEFPWPDSTTIATGMLAKTQTGAKTNVIVGIMDGATAIGQAIPVIQANLDLPVGVNNYTYLLIRNGGRANGGLASRVDWLYSLTGQSAVSGNVNTIKQCILDICQYIPVKLDVALGYDSIDDFPVAPAPVSILNSLMQSFLITNYLGERQNVTYNAGNNNFYVTVVPEDSALLEPLRLPGRPLGLLGLPDPFDFVADIFEPAADILINIGYNDVNLTTYQRSFQTFNGPNKQFLFDSTLTLDQQFAAITAAIGSIFSNITGVFGANPLSAATAAPAVKAAAAATTASEPQVAAAQQSVAATAATEAERSPTGKHRIATESDATVVATAGDAGADDSGDVPTTAKAPSNDEVALDGALADADEQADAAKENLDAAADEARERADDSLTGAEASTGDDQLAKTAATGSTTEPDSTPAKGDSSQPSQGDAASAASSAGDAAA